MADGHDERPGVVRKIGVAVLLALLAACGSDDDVSSSDGGPARVVTAAQVDPVMDESVDGSSTTAPASPSTSAVPTTSTTLPPSTTVPASSESHVVVAVQTPAPEDAGSIRICATDPSLTEDAELYTEAGSELARSAIGTVDLTFVSVAAGRYRVVTSWHGEPSSDGGVELGGGTASTAHTVEVVAGGTATVNCDA